VHWGRNIRIVGSSITGAGGGAAIMLTPNTAVISDLQATGNWLGGGGCAVNISEKDRGPIKGLVFSNNKFDRTSTSVTDCAIVAPSTTKAIWTATGNTWFDGTPARIR
ncbi:MAG: hypothetical protein JWN72_295, partial [Thermoleophilia bacterium]|nr:hypothetical protein [Thermoleophilia bacterium]